MGQAVAEERQLVPSELAGEPAAVDGKHWKDKREAMLTMRPLTPRSSICRTTA
ncbi:hypothetical protein [Sinorhizobium sp. CCBAU 05631]|uniref:hypothetical protein n=1 Tax=Sinorhizobium sp. CCBAU 05631 TaxID=794846 RepID=UPI0004AF3B58|nr:hypothetical protein [Sinorhizobium sp. CCBAU 05631]ASY59713.1 hypothetical protein SS05631_b56210 [Sinorhizobium sp. CCBAU 05631]